MSLVQGRQPQPPRSRSSKRVSETYFVTASEIQWRYHDYSFINFSSRDELMTFIRQTGLKSLKKMVLRSQFLARTVYRHYWLKRFLSEQLAQLVPPRKL